MEHELHFDKKKYLYNSMMKTLVFFLVYLIIFLLLVLVCDKSVLFKLLKVFAFCLVLFIFYFSAHIYIGYKYYMKDNFKCIYDENSLHYYHLRFVSLFEGFTALSSNYVRIELDVSRIDRVELKRGKIYVYGIMTLEKEATRLSQKIVGKYSFPDYFKDTEEFLKIVNKL